MALLMTIRLYKQYTKSTHCRVANLIRRLTARSSWVLFGVLLLAMLTSCTPNSDSEWDVYRDRLSRTLEIELNPPSPLKQPVATLPNKNPSNFQDINLDLSQLLALDSCGLSANSKDLSSLIAERNSILGKVMTPSTQLHYELQLLKSLNYCLQSTNANSAQLSITAKLDEELSQELQAILALKQQQLPERMHAFLLQDDTLRQQLQGSQRPLNLSSGQATETLGALDNLVRLRLAVANHDYHAASAIDINQQLALLYQGQVIADLQHSLRSNLNQLKALNDALQHWQPHWCKSATQNILQQVLLQVFIGRVQVQLAHQDGIAQQIIPKLSELYRETPFAPAIHLRFEQPWQALHAELKRHIAWWQQHEKQCQKA